MKKLFLLILAVLTASTVLTAQVSLVKDCQILNGWTYLSVDGDNIFFAASDNDHGYELWISDGTSTGTHMVKDINPGVNGGMFFGNTYAEQNSCIVFNNEFYFVADDGVHSLEIWKSDGTESGTVMLKDINPFGSVLGSNYDNYPYFCIVNGSLFFAGDDGNHGTELWKTDGTTAGTVMVKDIYPGFGDSEPFGLIAFGNEVYFRAWGENKGRELWKSDGTDAGTVMVKDIVPGLYGSFSVISSSLDPHFCVSGNYLYFRANSDSLSASIHLWRTDGTESGTIQLENHLTSGYLDETEDNFADVNGTFFFLADDNTPSLLWKSDGTVSGTVSVPTNSSLTAGGSFFNFNGVLMFDGHDNSGYGLCRSDGTTSGSHLVKSFPSLASSASVGEISTDGNFIYSGVLSAINNNAMEWRLMQSDGTTNGTERIPHFGFIGGLVSLNSKMYYGGYDTIINSEYTGEGLYEFTPLNVGVNDINADENVFVFPNPSPSGIFTLNFPSGKMITILSVFDLEGKKLYEKKMSEPLNEINLSHLPKGLYLLRMNDGDMVFEKKLIIQ